MYDQVVQRHRGFVVGKTSTSNGDYWTVRVKDESSPHNHKKLKVVSIADGLEPFKGLNVTFLVGTVDGPQGEKTEKAFALNIA